ncbi:MAG TPA: aminotransferase class IV [Chitinophagaceae bacterium]|nr:aminotransferase class IV [Chitinophagaceae bacterium]
MQTTNEINNKFICFNGLFISNKTAIVDASNRGLKYGDGFFETLRIINNKIVLKELHFNRLFNALQALHFEQPNFLTSDFLEEKILNLIQKNNFTTAAKVRINIFRGNGNLFEIENNYPNYIIEAEPLPNQFYEWDKTGLKVDFFIDAKKVCDNFSHLKTNNFLPYSMAAFWAKKNNLHSAIILNQHNCVADSAIANVWVIKNGEIQTPALTQGCIDGVMRKYLIKCFKEEGLPFKETALTIEDIVQAQEVFLTNVIKGISWVKFCGKTEYTNTTTQFIYSKFVHTLNSY